MIHYLCEVIFMKRIYTNLLFFLSSTCLAQTSLEVPDLSVPTKIAPAYFGPNAFPVPDMLTGRTSSVWKLEAYVDNYISTIYKWNEDYTAQHFPQADCSIIFRQGQSGYMGSPYGVFSYGERCMQDAQNP